MEEIGTRLKTLREGIHLSQAKMATLIGTNQTTIARVETGHTSPPLKLLLWYADYFDVSMDYIFCRTDKPQGKLYKSKPKAAVVKSKDMKQFIEMCFDPKSPMNGRLKQAILAMMEDEEK
ncbi:helix-turn-helix domain-containing protein [Oscillibacter sp.]|uniref:helix-turn-helix domain-containing protein n=1 Tax=Oscillibacter sp. TaxID=1945593 RepID=UPI003399F0A8